jgi:hypothetical protein
MFMVAVSTTRTAILVSRNRKILFMIQEIRSGRGDEFGSGVDMESECHI